VDAIMADRLSARIPSGHRRCILRRFTDSPVRFLADIPASCSVSIGCSPGGIWETGVLDASESQGNRPDEQP
jgi:hypothetical protein